MIPTPAARLHSEPLTPPPPRGAPLDLETLFFTRRIAGVQWSANGGGLFFETNVTGRFNIWQVPRRGGWPVQLTVSDERTALARPSPDGRWLLFTQDRGGNEKPNLFLQPLPHGRPRPITTTEGVAYRSMRWSPDGRSLAFAAERAASGVYDVYRLAPDGADVERVGGHDGGQCTTVRWSPDGRRLAVTRTWDYAHGGVGVLDLATKEERTLLPIDETADHQALGWTGDGRALLVSSNATPHGTYGIARVDAATAAVTWLDAGEWDVELLDVAPGGDRYVCARNEGGTHAVVLRAPDGGARTLALPPGMVADAAFSPDGSSLALLHGAATSPFELWVCDDAGASRRPVPRERGGADAPPVQVSRSLVGGLAADDFVRPSLVTYPSFDGTPISAFVYLPRGARPDRAAPAIVYVHGGPAAQHMNGWVPLVQYLVSHGFAVIAPNYRGSTGFGRAFEEANMRDMGGGDLRDVVAAAGTIAASGYVDPRRVAVMGGSYGGYLTLMALTKHPDRWAAGVAIVPFANWFTEYEHEDQTLRDSDRARMGDPVDDAELWRDRSPIFFADRIRAPLLVLAGANDVRCPADEAEQIARAVRANGGVAELQIYPDEGHGFRRRENEIDAHRRTAEFLRRHLGAPAAR
ncbi:MAG TPA: alpha/beta fold hydrolase [bacterium]|nr:alpha/beta fold hydrolase [bacterium]